MWQYSEGYSYESPPAHAWLKIAQIPIVKFEEEKFQGILTKRLFHVCMDIVTRQPEEALTLTHIHLRREWHSSLRPHGSCWIHRRYARKTHDCGCAAESITRLPSIVGPIRRQPSPRSSQRCSYLLAAAGFGEGGQSVRSPEIRERRKNRTIEWRPYAILVGLGIC